MSMRPKSTKNIVVPPSQPLLSFDSKKRKKTSETSPEHLNPPKRKPTMEEEDGTQNVTNNDLKEMEERIAVRLGNQIDKSLKEAVDSALSKLIESNNNAEMHPALSGLAKQTKQVVTSVKRIEDEQTKLKRKIQDLENRVLCNNIVLKGVTDTKWEEERETLNKVYQELSAVVEVQEGENRLEIAQRIGIRKCKRMGRFTEDTSRPRPISIELVHRQDALNLIDNKRKLNKGVYLDKEYPQDIERKCKTLRPILKAARDKAKYKRKSRMEDDKIIIKGKPYSVDNLDELPQDLEIFKITSKENNDTVAFFGELNPLSNFHPAKFNLGEISYHCSEQFIQHTKALYFNDSAAADRIMNTTTAKECKSISIGIENYDEDTWNTVAKDLCAKGINEKFLQNPDLLNVLLTRTGTKTIVEATKDDTWGTGVALHSPNCLVRTKWTSQGIMGEILQELRDSMRSATPGTSSTPAQSHPTAHNPHDTHVMESTSEQDTESIRDS